MSSLVGMRRNGRGEHAGVGPCHRRAWRETLGRTGRRAPRYGCPVLDVVILAGRYTLLEQDALDDLLPLCCERRVAVVAAGVFNSGLLARECPRDDAKYDYGEAPRRLIERAQAIARICAQHGTTLPAAALAFPLGHPAVASVCVGARSAAQIARNTALYCEPIAFDLWSELKAEGLLRTDAPVPD